MNTKRCPGCKEEKPLTPDFFYFRGSGNRKGKPCGYCKDCFSSQAKATKALQRIARLLNPEEEERKKLFKRCAHCKQEFPRTEEFWHFRPGRKPDSGRIPYGYCKPCNGAMSTTWKRNNRAQYRAWNNGDRRKTRAEVITRYGGKCACCGETRKEFLGIDHIHGGGRKHRLELSKQGVRDICWWLRKHGYPEGYRVLCHNCNQSLGLYGYCPHERERAMPAIDPKIQEYVDLLVEEAELLTGVNPVIFGKAS